MMQARDFFHRYINNFYFWFGLAFAIWIMFLDGNDLINRFQMQSKLKELEQEKAFYSKEIQRLKKEQKTLQVRPEFLEQFARENYFMKRKGEDIYIVEE
jgi:cell division protein DivIC